jgi:hypothetical protein
MSAHLQAKTIKHFFAYARPADGNEVLKLMVERHGDTTIILPEVAPPDSNPSESDVRYVVSDLPPIF